MRVSVFGLGYVGAVLCGCLARDGHQVMGVDLNPDKVAALNAGKSPISEERIGEIIAQAKKAGRLKATDSAAEAVAASEVSLVCVGTPSTSGGGVDLTAVRRVSREIGKALAKKEERHLVVVRSTVPPGTLRNDVVPALEVASGKRLGAGFGLCFNPEFLREGSSVRDHYDPPFTILGGDSHKDAEWAAELYANVEGETIITGIEEAEMVKYVCNAFHALKITFANEVGSLAKAMGVDGRRVMEIVCQDTKLNISPRYLRPGFAFGGSCLPKDMRALLHEARKRDLELPLLRGVLPSNQLLVERALETILAQGARRIGMVGLAFKPGTDDLRESPLVKLAEAMLGKGLELTIYDPAVDQARLVGTNRAYIEGQIPHLSALLAPDFAAMVTESQLLVVGHNLPALAGLEGLCPPGQTILDLAGVPELAELPGVKYQSITW